jgi:hypothetical protein
MLACPYNITLPRSSIVISPADYLQILSVNRKGILDLALWAIKTSLSGISEI